jgi:uncharacterized protein YkwD
MTVEVGRWKKRMILRYRWLVIAVLAALFAASSSGGQSAWAVDPYDPEELQFLEIINEYRQSNGLEALILSDALTLASERHSET